MAKFCGKIGYAETTETSPGVYKVVITERDYYGDVLEDTRRWQAGEGLNDDLTISNRISIVADPFAYQNFHTIRYVEWMGVLWKVNKIDIQRPRLILSIGGVYNGKKNPAPIAP